MLAERLPKVKLDLLIQKSLAHRSGQMGYGDYHRFLRSLCQTNHIPLEGLRQLADYIAYVILAEDIDRDALLDELERLEMEVQDNLATTPAQKRLVALSRRLALLEKLSTQSMTPKDWASYERDRPGILSLPADIAAMGGIQGPTPPPSQERNVPSRGALLLLGGRSQSSRHRGRQSR